MVNIGERMKNVMVFVDLFFEEFLFFHFFCTQFDLFAEVFLGLTQGLE